MVKVANAVPVFGYLRDIRLSALKRSNGDKLEPTNGSRRHNGEPPEEAFLAREQTGYERGQREAEERHRREIEELRRQWEEDHAADVLKLLENMNQVLQQQTGEMFRSLEKHLVMLTAEAAIKITAGIPISADLVEACVREALGQVERETEITVLLHPEDLTLLEQHQSSLLNRSSGSPTLRFRAEQKVGRGGCMLETKFGELDGRRDTKIELLKRAVNE